MSDIKDRLTDAGHKVADTAAAAGHAVAEKAGQAADWVKEKAGMGTKEGSDAGVGGIKERMDVIASCGKKVGVVDHVDGAAIKLTRKDSSDGQHHFIPTGWVARVDSHVHLTKNSVETEQGWKPDAAACASCGS